MLSPPILATCRKDRVNLLWTTITSSRDYGFFYIKCSIFNQQLLDILRVKTKKENKNNRNRPMGKYMLSDIDLQNNCVYFVQEKR